MSKIKLNLIQRVKLWIWGHVKSREIQKPGWKVSIQHYYFRCKKHGIVEDYPHGFTQKFTCPKCLKEGRIKE